MPRVEFIVEGSPTSHQTKNKKALHAWKLRVRSEAGKVWTQPPLTGLVQCTIINFFEGTQAPLDDDNLVKPIRDALNGLVYQDDKQITHSETIQYGIDAPVKIRRGSSVLLDAYGKGEEFLYVRIDHAPDFIQLPR